MAEHYLIPVEKTNGTIGFLDLENHTLETNFNFLRALDQKLYWKTCIWVMAENVNVTTYVARTHRSRCFA